MKITEINTHVMGIVGAGNFAPSRNWIFVEVKTDEGITGVGEATTEYHEHAVVAMVDQHFAPLLHGQDPTQVNRCWQQMQRGFWWRGGVVAASAASGIEQALWDISGKAANLPVHRLLGGKVRDKVRLYARTDLGLPTCGEEAAAAWEEGFTAFKFGPGKRVDPFDDLAQVDEAVDFTHQANVATDGQAQLMIDCGGIFSQQAATELVRRLTAFPMLFVEEPVNMDVPRGLLELRRAFPGVRIAAGERLATRWAFREWLERAVVDVIQPDVCHCGGIAELLRVASYAETYNVTVAPHNPYGPVALAANLHAALCMPNFLILEHCRHRPWMDDVVRDAPRVERGLLHASDAPGLGVELDWDYVRAHPYQRLPLRLGQDAYGAMPLL